MGRNVNNSKLTKQYVLSKVSQITIFSTYLNLSDNIVQHCIDTGELICSPLRDDVHPTCGFKYDIKGKLKFRDFAGYIWGDCFDIVAYIMSGLYKKDYDINNKHDFIKVLRHITFTFKDIFYGQEKDINLINDINSTIISIKNKKPIIELVVRQWNDKDIAYWQSFGISISMLNINFVYPIEQYYINRKVNPQPKYYYNDKDPCYGYFLGQDKNGINNIKLYFPKRTKDITRFITNCNHLEGIYNLNKKDYNIIVITKSTKDRLSIACTIERIAFLYGGVDKDKIGVINIPHETYRLRQNEYDWLRSKLDLNGRICSLMDNDETGIIEAKWLRDNYNIIPIIIPRKYNSKDFSELVKNTDISTISNITIETINYINSYERINNKYIRYKEIDDALPF